MAAFGRDCCAEAKKKKNQSRPTMKANDHFAGVTVKASFDCISVQPPFFLPISSSTSLFFAPVSPSFSVVFLPSLLSDKVDCSN